MAKTVIVAAGRSTRLDGACKLLVEAAGQPVHKWHTDVWGQETDAIVLPEHVDALGDAGWNGNIYGVDAGGGPARALLEYMDTVQEKDVVNVVYADSLLRHRPNAKGDWVGVSIAQSGREWDFWNGFSWARGMPKVEVCCGVYQFSNGELLLEILRGVEYPSGEEVGMTTVLRRYDHEQRLERLWIRDWQDAGDWEAIRKVER